MKKYLSIYFKTILIGLYIIPVIAQSQELLQKYNVLFISTHDMNFRVDFNGDPGPYLPNLDRLASKGIVFKNNYCQYPFCSPSRTSLLTGWRPDRTGIYNDLVRPRSVLGPDVKFLPEYFGVYGYRTERYGIVTQNKFANDIKWDYAEPPEGSESANKILAESEKAGAWWIDNEPDSQRQNAPWAIDLVKRLQQPVSQPFFYALGFNETHSPFSPNLSKWNKNGDPAVQDRLPDANGDTSVFVGNGSANIVLPNTPPGDRTDIPSIAFNIDPVVKPDYEWKKTIHAYYGEVSQIDTYIGWVFDEMDKQKLWDNTIVVFWSDHGQHLGEHEGTWLKLTLFEESARTPLIIYVPGKKPGICYRVTENVDLYATLAELCGLPVPPDMEGSSLAPLIDDPTLPWKRAIFSQVKRPGFMARSARTEDFHYNSWGTNGEELYDLRTDSFEYTNLVTNAAYTKILDSMRLILSDGWAKSLPPKYTLQTFYRDADKDGYGSSSDSAHTYAVQPGYVSNTGDCNDTNSTVYPGAPELCDGIDNNCNSKIDEGLPRAKITYTGSLDICATGLITLRANAGINLSYQWKRNGVNISGATARTYTATTPGTYRVMVTQSGGCSKVSQGIAVTSSCISTSFKK